MSEYTEALAALMERELRATTDAERREIRKEREALLKSNHRGDVPLEPLRLVHPPDVGFDPKQAQTGERDE